MEYLAPILYALVVFVVFFLVGWGSGDFGNPNKDDKDK